MRAVLLSLIVASAASLATFSAVADHDRAHLQGLARRIDATLEQGRFDGPTLDATEQDLKRVLRRLRQGQAGAGPRGQVGGGVAGIDLIALDRACDDILSSNDKEAHCVSVLRRSRFDPRPAMKQCEDAMDGDDNELQCIVEVGRARRDPVDGIRACERAFNGDRAELQCIGAVAGAWGPGAEIIKVCEDAFDGDANELTCIGVAPQLGRRAVEIIRYCEDKMSGDEAELACMRGMPGR